MLFFGWAAFTNKMRHLLRRAMLSDSRLSHTQHFGNRTFLDCIRRRHLKRTNLFDDDDDDDDDDEIAYFIVCTKTRKLI